VLTWLQQHRTHVTAQPQRHRHGLFLADILCEVDFQNAGCFVISEETYPLVGILLVLGRWQLLVLHYNSLCRKREAIDVLGGDVRCVRRIVLSPA